MIPEIEHGGALDRAVARFGGKPADWLDLSTGINPEHFPLPVFEAALWNRLPDERLLHEALRLARAYYRLDVDAPLVAAPGTQALIQLIPTLLPPSTVAILGPTYQEHAASFSTAGWQVVECMVLEDIPDHVQAVVVVNPNNPDGRVVGTQDLLQLAERLQTKGGFLIVDEAFADTRQDVSIAAEACGMPIVVLKSFGKFFGLAGLRLGFAISNAAIVQQIARCLGPWAVSSPALAVAAHAFGKPEQLCAFRARIDLRRLRLSGVLQRSRLDEIGGTALFSLVEHRDAQALHTALCERHILVRKFAYAPQWLRIGLALDDAALERLEEALRA